jgi:hypothetical protein
MPYIKKEDRLRLEADPTDIRTAGELNYSVYKYAKSRITNYQSLNDIVANLEQAIHFFLNRDMLQHPNNFEFVACLCYQAQKNITRLDIVGALRCCELEIYRRLAAPYEDLKIKENGDVE